MALMIYFGTLIPLSWIAVRAAFAVWTYQNFLRDKRAHIEEDWLRSRPWTWREEMSGPVWNVIRIFVRFWVWDEEPLRPEWAKGDRA